MDIGSATNQALIGMQSSQREMVNSAQQIAAAGTTQTQSQSAAQPVAGNTMDVVEPLINITQQQQVFDASARVVSAESENLGRLIDTEA
ncbi:hypothetical protein [Marinimicrobium alkaliphilum]|uniref:hypothetical protein n=1 Tax=Marinimicrobium alkaliphilum TaxID=2202654 RepID=UPI000DB942FD|nr:hypothetical protein [Marinimicrobium alkaliphilum]